MVIRIFIVKFWLFGIKCIGFREGGSYSEMREVLNCDIDGKANFEGRNRSEVGKFWIDVLINSFYFKGRV